MCFSDVNNEEESCNLLNRPTGMYIYVYLNKLEREACKNIFVHFYIFHMLFIRLNNTASVKFTTG